MSIAVQTNHLTDDSTVQGSVEQSSLRDERYASSYLGLSVQTLRAWRTQGRGPRFRKLGRCVRYRMCDLIVFVESQPSGGGDAAGSAGVAV